MQLRKGCELYAVNIDDLLLNDSPTYIRDHPVLSEFIDVFPEEILGIPPPWEINFYIEIIPMSTWASKVPYQMSITELTKLKIKLQEILYRGYIKPSVSP